MKLIIHCIMLIHYLKATENRKCPARVRYMPRKTQVKGSVLWSPARARCPKPLASAIFKSRRYFGHNCLQLTYYIADS